MSGAPLPVPEPGVSPEAKPFWEAAAEGRLLLQRCTSCRVVVWYPRGICPACSGLVLEWFEGSGKGVVYSFTIIRRGDGAYKEAAPYVLAYVELAEGPRVLTNLVDCDPESVRVGDAVTAVFPRTAGGVALVRFRPV